MKSWNSWSRQADGRTCDNVDNQKQGNRFSLHGKTPEAGRVGAQRVQMLFWLKYLVSGFSLRTLRALRETVVFKSKNSVHLARSPCSLEPAELTEKFFSHGPTQTKADNSKSAFKALVLILSVCV
jgi:hypothetical protein